MLLKGQWSKFTSRFTRPVQEVLLVNNFCTVAEEFFISETIGNLYRLRFFKSNWFTTHFFPFLVTIHVHAKKTKLCYLHCLWECQFPVGTVSGRFPQSYGFQLHFSNHMVGNALPHHNYWKYHKTPPRLDNFSICPSRLCRNIYHWVVQ